MVSVMTLSGISRQGTYQLSCVLVLVRRCLERLDSMDQVHSYTGELGSVKDLVRLISGLQGWDCQGCSTYRNATAVGFGMLTMTAAHST